MQDWSGEAVCDGAEIECYRSAVAQHMIACSRTRCRHCCCCVLLSDLSYKGIENSECRGFWKVKCQKLDILECQPSDS